MAVAIVPIAISIIESTFLAKYKSDSIITRMCLMMAVSSDDVSLIGAVSFTFTPYYSKSYLCGMYCNPVGGGC
eukprot:7060383-Ditylum_brightwellii.AAC.1